MENVRHAEEITFDFINGVTINSISKTWLDFTKTNILISSSVPGYKSI